jgi:predicted dehydrogenase
MGHEIDRREFMRRATATSIGAGIALTGIGAGNVLGANEKVRIGLIGSGKQGVSNMQSFAKQPEVEVVAVADVYEPNLQKGLKAAGEKAQAYRDFRQLLDRKDIDAVIVATPDHWHPLQTILACQAGKDVYVEKPIAVAVEEGKRMVEAARKYQRVVQVGTWQRSGIHFQKAIQLVQDGLIGKVSLVRCWNYTNLYPEGIGNPPDCDPPAGLDWDSWLGPAPKVPFNWNRFGLPYDGHDRWSTFRYFWDYANGWLGDWGVHVLDIAQWAMKVDGPNVITSPGGRFYLQDNSDVPDTLQTTLEYPGFVCLYENRLLNENSMWGKGYGTEFHGTDGTLFVDRSGFQVFPEKRKIENKSVDRTPTVQMESANDALDDHVRNFLDCIKSRQRPVSDIEIGHRSTSTCLLGNVAYRTKERLVWDAANQKMIQGSAEARKLLSREYRAPWKLTV